MEMPSSMFWALYEVFEELDIGHLSFYCDKSERESVANCFKSAIGECTITQKPKGFDVAFSALTYDDYDEDFGFTSISVAPIDHALHAVEVNFPNIRYQGVTCYAFRTLQGGDMGWTVYSHGVSDHDVYEPIGEALAGALEEDVFWMYLLEETDLTDTEVREIQEFCMAYADYLREEGLEKLNSFTTELL